MNTVIDLFSRHGYMLELLVCVAATTWKLERQERFAARLTGILLAEACFIIVWEQVPHNLYTESLRTFLLWSIAAVGIGLCFRIAAAWAVFYATAAGTMQHIIYRGAKLLQNAVYHMDRQYWAWSRWVYLGLFVLLYVLAYWVFTRRLHSRNLGALPGRTMTFILIGYQLSLNIFVNLFNAYSLGGDPHIFTLYSLFDEVTAVLLFFLLCEILERSDAEWDNAVLQQMMRQQRQQMELSKETVELINIKCHDIRKQLYTLGSRVPAEELDELKKAVDIYDSTVKTGSETLDVLLAERSIVCKGRGIQLDYIADGAKLGFLKPGEIYSLFGNALDNAIEAVTPLEPERRYIGLQVRAERGMLLIRMENCMDETPRFVDGLPQTTKGDARWHGFGVKSIRRIVEQHGGTVTMQAGDGMFRLVALLPLK